MSKKRTIVTQYSYNKGVEYSKQKLIELIETSDTKIFVLKIGKYDDGKEFISVTIDNI